MFTNHRATLFLIDKRRSSAVPRKILGNKPVPVVTLDCYTSYGFLKCDKQKCWAHLLRDTSELESEEGKHLHERLKHLRNEAKIMSKMPPPLRNAAARLLQHKMDHLVNKYLKDPPTAKIAERIIRHSSG